LVVTIAGILLGGRGALAMTLLATAGRRRASIC
jgi:hypothetical protein